MWGKVIHLWKDWNLTNIVPGIWVVITWSLVLDLSHSSSSILNGASCSPGWPPPIPTPPFPSLGSPHASPAQCHPLSLEASLSRSASNVHLKTFTLAHLPCWSTGNSCPVPPLTPPSFFCRVYESSSFIIAQMNSPISKCLGQAADNDAALCHSGEWWHLSNAVYIGD